jgi:catechol 2,3-dioxygenase-like lactoylglutathione lyase family enzyme
MVAATYVRDIDASRDFYELLGFAEQSTGRAATSAWSTLRHGDCRLLLASTEPPLEIPALPLLFYFFFDDLSAVVEALRAADVDLEHTGHPPHALGGELKLLDPDGNTVLIGQQQASLSQEQHGQEDTSAQFSLLKEAADLVAARGGRTARCRVRNHGGAVCRREAEVKLADSAGDGAWACLDHAHEILLTVPDAFIASPGEQGIADFLARRGR